MTEQELFADFMARIRAGDQTAAEELVRRYEPLVKRQIRVKMTDRRMAQMFDSMDVCQSIWASFFVRAAAGQYDLDSPQNLAKLLLTMAKNKIVTQARRHHYQKRDVGRMEASESALANTLDQNPSPSSAASANELFTRLQEILSDDERRVANLRRGGLSWEAVADELGGTPQARRMQLVRAADRVINQLGLED